MSFTAVWSRIVRTVFVGGNRESKRLPWLTLLVGAVAVSIHWLPSEIALVFQLDRSMVGHSWWQLVTGHWVHWNESHLFWDVAMFVVLGTWVERHSRKVWLAVLGATSLFVSAAFMLGLPELQYYRGLSGLDMALAAYWISIQLWEAIRGGSRGERWLWIGALGLLFAKTFFETAWGRALFASDLGEGVANVPLAHLVGALTGGIVACLRSRWKERIGNQRLVGLQLAASRE